MKLTNLLAHTFKVVAKHREIFLVYSFVYAVMLFAALFLGSFGGLTLVLVIFIYLPIQFSLYYVALKMQNEKPIIPQDIYIGFKGFLSSIALGSKMMFRGFFNGVLSFVISLLVGGIILGTYLVNNFSGLVDFIAANPNNLEAISLELDRYPEVINLVLIVYSLGIVVAGIFYLVETSKNSIAPFVLLEAPFELNSSIKISRDVNLKNKRLLISLYAFFFALLILIILILGVITTILFNGGSFSDLALLALILVMFTLLFAPLNILFVVAKSSYYQLSGKVAVLKILEEVKAGLKNVNNPQK